ncbi:2-dehydropantoate 2-reductase [Exiguobacterium sp. BMC-KP]|uniref:ketopantoate reductase family protein n=1 Tax=Exiguobacterium sp. BMC-KP TaxID=1684312 RepID=UPI0006AA531B|nr:2-dehydropantoate 2-reductase [Exiguobacterium sp. BMC-KP]KOP30583.1 2-dehydropantoate 2-reductase [Exiguobacterium sp. BMC-KP]
MNIGIIGAGAIGLLLASYLSEEHSVTLYTRQEQEEERPVILDGQASRLVRVRKIDRLESEDLVFVATKSYDIKSVIPILERLTCPVMFLQNGMDHLQWKERLPHVLFGVVEHGAMRTAPFEVKHTGKGRIRYGNEAISNLSSKQLCFEFESDMEAVLLTKLFINVVINPVTAFYGVENGCLLDMPYRQEARQLFDEMRTIFPHHDITYSEIERIMKNTSKNRSSMLRDLEHGRQTEVEPILGYALRQATTVTPRLSFYYEQIKQREGPQ